MKLQDLKISEEFKNKIPPLSEDEFKQLEENIVNDGEVYEPLTVWNGTIVDGHNRYRVLCNHPEIPYKIREMNFSDKWDAFEWMYKNQLGRRNLTEQHRTYVIGKMYEARRHTVGAPIGNKNATKQCDQNEHIKSSGRISDQIGKELGIGSTSVRRAYDYAQSIDDVRNIDPSIADKILSGQAKIAKAAVVRMKDADADEKKQVIDAIRNNKEIPKTKHINRQESIERNNAIDKAIDGFLNNQEQEYGIDDLVDDVRRNCKLSVKTIVALIESRREVLDSKENKQKVADCLNQHFVGAIKQYLEGIRA